ncbi:MAG: glycosyltransferase [Planctomycetes bacterium]|nr:glycosyltransferase [Planctomycetota bacterium]MCB9871893.1 glycosyltransferase [Planctomycetota bacterium]MCB9888843.1 glycosyltransferase [Planctomycetota bacterium]
MTAQTVTPRGSSGAPWAGPAVAYFAKAPRPGSVKTRLCPPLTTEEAAAIYGAFLCRIVVPVPGARTHVFGWPEDELTMIEAHLAPEVRSGGLVLRPQRGDDLWGRMRSCFDELFAAGHAPVVIRNTDSPEVGVETVREAIDRAAPGRVVLGPDFGGGYYLVALCAPCPELFAPVEGGAAAVFTATRERARRLGLEVVELVPRPDVDTYADLLAMWARRVDQG